MGRYSLNGPPGNLTFVAGDPADLDRTPAVTNPKNDGAAEKNAQRLPEGMGYDSKGESTALGVSFSDWQDLLCVIGSKTTATHDSNRSDLLPRIKGLFRLLDLYSEAGSYGLVDKIIISQESLGRFINRLLPGAYTSITKIDLARLDREASLRLVGIYGSKSEIVRFLFSLGSIDVKVAALLLVKDDVSVNMRPSLRSGIYILSPPPQAGSSPNVRYVIYWPEETTWNDDATGGVRQNRVTFMRYLTSLTDQIHALISSEHEAELVFQDVDLDDDSGGDGSEMSWSDYEDANVDDRLFKFEVAKTNEQEEAVNLKAGFTVTVPHAAYCLSTANIPTSRGSTRQVTLTPRFVGGETVQAVATIRFVPGVDHTHRLDEAFSEYRFDAELKKYGSVIISPSVDATAFGILLEKGNLRTRDRAAYETYCSAIREAQRRCEKEEKEALEKSKAEIRENRPHLLDQVSNYLVSFLCDTYPTFGPEDILPSQGQPGETNMSQTSDPLEYFHNVCATYKSADRAWQHTVKETDFTCINFPKFTKLKRRFIIVKGVLEKHKDLSEAQRSDLVNAVSIDDDLPAALKETQASWTKLNPLHDIKALASKLNFLNGSNDEKAFLGQYSKVNELDDAEFLRSLHDIVAEEPIFAASVMELRELALRGLCQMLEARAKTVTENMIRAQETELRDAAKALAKAHIEEAKHEAISTLRQAIEAKLFGEGKQPVLTIYDVKPKSAYRHWGSEFVLKASYSWSSDPFLETSVWALDLSEDDRQKLKENPSHVPTPRMPRSAAKFSLPLEWRIRRLQILGQKKALLIVDCPDKIRLWLFPLQTGFSIDRPTCSIPNVPGRQYVFAVDQHTRLVALTMTELSGNVVLQQYLMDETFLTMHSRGSPLSLNTWYTDGTPEFVHASFFSGTEELCLVEVTGRVRVLLIPSRSFRPASVHLDSNPLYVSSSPDGAALVAVEGSPTGTKSIRVFHRASFGSNQDGIVIILPESFNSTSNFCITSTGERQNVFLMAFDAARERIISVALKISRQEAEYQFRTKGKASNAAKKTTTIHNSLIDCFSEVWERFPVAAAIQRQTLSEAGRQATSVTFVSSLASHSFKSYFKRMVQDFERLSHKPTEQRLSRIIVTSSPFDQVFCRSNSTSQYKAGEWIAELLCLIPIHIAMVSENRFVPLKDGIFDSALERELVGAGVSKIIDSICLGWYESIFSSYMATKPVKVVSCMGEQSVGKSYSLNHMVDSSFAGSAVRTTEGVWLSICPTKDCLVVALDFEGVHSLERTHQEDMLLVLFNTAVSNLVIFRNNFALNRNVANMFTSFQASTHFFDPAANPRLFKGLLTIVIKDVMDADKKDIIKEFCAKFSQIVSKEQASNFITVLHNSQLTVIPWSVISSPDFYRLFGKLGKALFRQKTTHDSAGEFLITLKTLMAKMKAQDWGSLDHTIIKHRVTALTKLLPNVLTVGRLGPEADGEELKNMDNQIPIARNDTSAAFCLEQDDAERAAALARLIKEWDSDAARRATNDLVQHLQDVAVRRIATTREWIQQNVSRFSQDNVDMRVLKRRFDDLSEALLANIQLCLAECTSCRLRCMLNRSHATQEHECGTSHRCIEPCEYTDDHDAEECCGLLAGHGGRHICDPSSHLCGAPCHLSSRRGCQGHCVKPSDDDHTEHTCSARVHLCGEACDLRDLRLPGGRQFSCNMPCTLPYDEDHVRHMCDNRLACPVACELCSRLCATGDHFHGMVDDALHLCGQSHACNHQCEAAGICEINTTPHSVEADFTGRHSTFSYTKYTQVAKRLDCAVAIPAGARHHSGPHVHSDDPKCFHYCETRCLNCGYFCNLPLGHPQAEHDTAHGSIELTTWAVEGNADAVVEVQGRRFAAQETAAPQFCSSICQTLGRHAHIDYCRNVKGQECREAESEHIATRMLPNLDRQKDWISHREFWTRAGFKDPYSSDDKSKFALCNVQCTGSEHEATAHRPARQSYCTLPIFHPPQPVDWSAPGNDSYVSPDGHSFACSKPNHLRQAFHVMFVLDRSGSMGSGDRRPLPGQPVTAIISQHNNNRFGAVLSAVYGFWVSRGSGDQGGRRDAYSVITYDSSAQVQFANDLNSTPDQLLHSIVQEPTRGGTNFDAALRTAQTTMESHWSTERSPVLIFLSNGECGVSDNVIHDICNRAVARGKPLSLHSVSFGSAASSASLRRMVTIAEQVAANAPPNPLNPLVPCGYTDVMDTIRLAETLLNIADSLKKPRAALLRA